MERRRFTNSERFSKYIKINSAKGRAGFYEGKTADLIVKEMKRGNGIISHEDLKEYQSVWRTPVSGNYKVLK